MTPTASLIAYRVGDIPTTWWCVVARQPHRGGRGLLHWEYTVPLGELRAAQDAGYVLTVQRRDADATVLLARRRPAQ